MIALSVSDGAPEGVGPYLSFAAPGLLGFPRDPKDVADEVTTSSPGVISLALGINL
jgi:hypothetical protein